MWKDLKIGKKLFVAFGAIVMILAIVAIWSITGIGGIVKNADEVIEGNKLRTNLEEKYKQHLLWSQNLNQFLTNDEITELSVQTDYNKCAFGKWYYGEGKANAIKLAPALEPIIAKFEEPHKHLHESAIEIDNVYRNADTKLGAILRDAKIAHLQWLHNVNSAIANRETKLAVQKDHTKCGFGVWLNSNKVNELLAHNPEFNSLFENLKAEHENLHKSANDIERALINRNYDNAASIYNKVSLPVAENTLTHITNLINWQNEAMTGKNNALAIYQNRTLGELDKMGKLFTEVIEKSKNEIMTDKVMLAKADSTRTVVMLLAVVAVVISILLGFIITRGIVGPIKVSLGFAKKIAKGDLTAEVKCDSNDEVGQLCKALNEMSVRLKEIIIEIKSGAESIASASMQMSSTSQTVSQGASEQASSTEEVSASMEEMTANIQQNSNNSQQTESIAKKAVAKIKEGNESTIVAVNSMEDIADKIQIINDIAFQTNILALNAAVEAARAGEHGKGFAVVAAEVRKLAERSKVAADEINLISNSGVQISKKAGEQLAELIPDIEKTAQLVQEITASSNEQNSGADQINNAVQQLSQITQQNAAASEEMASSSEELASQAEGLKDLVGFFKVDNNSVINRTITKTELQEKQRINKVKNLKQESKMLKETSGARIEFSETIADENF